jgi:hypothetical protein
MNFTVPIFIKEVVNVDLPFSLYKDNDFEFFLTEFSIADREKIFSITNLIVQEDDKATYNKTSHTLYYSSENVSQFIISKYRVLIKAKDGTEATIEQYNRLNIDLDFCCLLYFNYPITLIIFGDDGMGKQHISGQSFNRKSEKIIINQEIINSFVRTLSLCIKNESVKVKKKRMLHSLLKTSSLRTFNAGLTCSTYITILESLFTKNENTEITFRFKMRFTKYMNEKIEFSNKIKTLYGKRSSYYHTGEIDFTLEEEKYLSELTRKIIVEYIQAPNNFEISRLDELLLS